MPPLLAAALGSILRHVFTLGAGMLVARGIWQPNEAEEYVTGLVIFALSFAWSYLEKRRAAHRVDVALMLPKGATIDDLEAKLATDRARPGPLAVFLIGVLALSLGVGCAARGARNRTRVAALAAGDAAVELDKIEAGLYAGGVYDKSTHEAIGARVLALLYAVRGFERAAAGWQAGSSSAAVTAARDGVLAALADFERAAPAGRVRDAFAAALAAIRAAVTASSAQLEATAPVRTAELPPGGLAGAFALLNIIAGLVASGRSTVERILAALKAEGATDAELAAVDVELTDAIFRREAERQQPPAPPEP